MVSQAEVMKSPVKFWRNFEVISAWVPDHLDMLAIEEEIILKSRNVLLFWKATWMCTILSIEWLVIKKKHKYTNVHKIKRYVTGKKSKYFNEA